MFVSSLFLFAAFVVVVVVAVEEEMEEEDEVILLAYFEAKCRTLIKKVRNKI